MMTEDSVISVSTGFEGQCNEEVMIHDSYVMNEVELIT